MTLLNEWIEDDDEITANNLLTEESQMSFSIAATTTAGHSQSLQIRQKSDDAPRM